jgi:hypothetical protein
MKENDFRCEGSVEFLLNSCEEKVTRVTTPQPADNSELTGCKVVSTVAS